MCDAETRLGRHTQLQVPVMPCTGYVSKISLPSVFSSVKGETEVVKKVTGMKELAQFPALENSQQIIAIFIVAIFTNTVDSCCQTLFGFVTQHFFPGEAGLRHHAHGSDVQLI